MYEKLDSIFLSALQDPVRIKRTIEKKNETKFQVSKKSELEALKRKQYHRQQNK